MIYTITLNPAVDYVATLSKFESGSLNRTDTENFYPGGKGINVSRLLTRLGVENTALGFVAGFTGQFMEDSLALESVQTNFIHLPSGNTRIGVKLKAGSEETEINAKGPEVSEDQVRKLVEMCDSIEPQDFLVLAGKVANGMDEGFYEQLMEAYSDRFKVVVDATGSALLKTLPFKPFLIKPNQHEIGEIFGVTLEDEADILYYGLKLQEMGAKNVLISLGGHGAILITAEGTLLRSNVPAGVVKNSVGAGDSMVAGFLAGYVLTEDYEQALKMGAACGSATAFSSDLAEAGFIKELFKEIQVKDMRRK